MNSNLPNMLNGKMPDPPSKDTQDPRLRSPGLSSNISRAEHQTILAREIRKAREEEREACAQICDEMDQIIEERLLGDCADMGITSGYGAAIRARGTSDALGELQRLGQEFDADVQPPCDTEPKD